MNVYLISLLLSQIILPELPPPPELEPPADRPVVVPLGYDTLGVEIVLASRLGFEFTARRNAPGLIGRTSLGMYERRDYFKGAEQRARIDITRCFNSLQLGAGADVAAYQSASCEQSYGTLSLRGMWQGTDLLAGLSAQGYDSRMSDELREGIILTSTLFIPTDWARFLLRVRGSAEPEGELLVADGFIQYQWRSVLITPRLQTRVPFGVSAGGSILALLGNVTLELEGDYRHLQPVLLDSFLLDPVTASLASGTNPWLIQDRLRLVAGYRGVEVAVFFTNGNHLYWQMSADGSMPGITSGDFFRTGAEMSVDLERSGVSNQSTLRVLAFEPDNTWTPLWGFTDSLSFHRKGWGGFVAIEAGGERATGEVLAEPYALVGFGVYFEREPFRALLRADDLFDRRPQRWPGLAEPGRRLSLSCALFSSRW